MYKKIVYPMCYVGPSMKGLRHGMIFKDKESAIRARMKYRGTVPFDEFMVPTELYPTVNQQIKNKNGVYYVLYKSVKGEH